MSQVVEAPDRSAAGTDGLANGRDCNEGRIQCL
jgi:hypothetical protein